MKHYHTFLVLTLLSTCFTTSPALSSTFTDWTTINTDTSVAVGSIDGVSVVFSGSNLDTGVTNGSSSAFDSPLFTPPLPNSDLVGFRGSPAVYNYVLDFAIPVLDPVMHLGSLASILTFSSILTKVIICDFVIT